MLARIPVEVMLSFTKTRKSYQSGHFGENKPRIPNFS